MPNEYQLTSLEISLTTELLDVLARMAELEGKTLNAKIVSLLDMAICIEPEDLAMIKDKAKRKDALDQLAADEDNMVERYKAIMAATKQAADTLESLKK